MRLQLVAMREDLIKSSVGSELEARVEAALKAPYRRELIPIEDGTWFARVAELSGCMTEGATREEALANLDDAMREWLSVQLEDGDSIPMPAASVTYSGKLLLRISQQLHRQVSECAERSGVSLNAFISSAIAKVVGEEYAPIQNRVMTSSQSLVVGASIIGTLMNGLSNSTPTLAGPIPNDGVDAGIIWSPAGLGFPLIPLP